MSSCACCCEGKGCSECCFCGRPFEAGLLAAQARIQELEETLRGIERHCFLVTNENAKKDGNLLAVQNTARRALQRNGDLK